MENCAGSHVRLIILLCICFTLCGVVYFGYFCSDKVCALTLRDSTPEYPRDYPRFIPRTEHNDLYKPTSALPRPHSKTNHRQGVVLVAPGIMLEHRSSYGGQDISVVESSSSKSDFSPLARINRAYEKRSKWGIAFTEALQEINHNLPNIEWPFLVLHGSSDHIVDVAGSRALHELANSKDKTLKIYRGAYHNLLHDILEIRARALEDVFSWIGERMNQNK